MSVSICDRQRTRGPSGAGVSMRMPLSRTALCVPTYRSGGACRLSQLTYTGTSACSCLSVGGLCGMR